MGKGHPCVDTQSHFYGSQKAYQRLCNLLQGTLRTGRGALEK